MDNSQSYRAGVAPVGKCLPQNIGIVYCTSSQVAAGREFEQIADCEVIEVAHAVQAALRAKGCRVQLVDLDPQRISDLCAFDWVVNLAETIYGFPLADYEVADQMERLKINFTGSGSQALKACLDKGVTKSELRCYGVTTPAYNVIAQGDPVSTQCSYPVMVKPVHEDGSIGISNQSIATNLAELALRVEKIHTVYQQAALVEEFIDGRDITASILGNGEEAVVLPLSEITYPDRGGSKFLTFDAKWISDSQEFQAAVACCPCEVDPETEAAIKQTALRAYRIMGCRDYARVDFRLKDHIPYVLEVNPNPCINPDDSGFIRCGKAAGFDYNHLIHQILLSSVKFSSQAPALVSYSSQKVDLSS
jgi:D-alanine-D-alanine ligase